MIWSHLYLGQEPTRTERKLESFRSLPLGWHYGEGGPINDGLIARAKKMYGTLLRLGLSRTNAFPGADGEVTLTGRHLEHHVEITLHADGSTSLVYERNDAEELELDQRAEAEIRRALSDISRAICGTSDFSIHSTSIGTRIGSRVLRSRTSTADSQSSTLSAPTA